MKCVQNSTCSCLVHTVQYLLYTSRYYSTPKGCYRQSKRCTFRPRFTRVALLGRFCAPRSRLSRGPPARSRCCMDELVAATAAFDMATDANAPKDLEQRSVCGTVGAVWSIFSMWRPRRRTRRTTTSTLPPKTPRMLFRRYRSTLKCCSARHVPRPSLDEMATPSHPVDGHAAGASQVAAAEGQQHVP